MLEIIGIILQARIPFDHVLLLSILNDRCVLQSWSEIPLSKRLLLMAVALIRDESK
jgi:hypothetical protein